RPYFRKPGVIRAKERVAVHAPPSHSARASSRTSSRPRTWNSSSVRLLDVAGVVRADQAVAVNRHACDLLADAGPDGRVPEEDDRPVAVDDLHRRPVERDAVLLAYRPTGAVQLVVELGVGVPGVVQRPGRRDPPVDVAVGVHPSRPSLLPDVE